MSRTRMFTYILLTMSVKQAASMASLLAMLTENKSIEVLDHDEVTRRIIIRASPSDVGFLELVVERYAASASFEIKAYVRKSIDEKILGKINAKYIRHNRLLFYWICNKGAVFGEKKHRSRLLLKYCRKTIGADPASIPYSLCSFDPLQHKIAATLDDAYECFEKFIKALGENGKESLRTN